LTFQDETSKVISATTASHNSPAKRRASSQTYSSQERSRKRISREEEEALEEDEADFEESSAEEYEDTEDETEDEDSSVEYDAMSAAATSTATIAEPRLMSTASTHTSTSTTISHMVPTPMTLQYNNRGFPYQEPYCFQSSSYNGTNLTPATGTTTMASLDKSLYSLPPFDCTSEDFIQSMRELVEVLLGRQ